MQIYLLKDLKGHGKAGDIVNVNDGYAKNFVIKNKIGKVADSAVLSEIKSKKDSQSFKQQTEVAEINILISKLREIEINLTPKIGANGKLFGGITATDLAHELSNKGLSIDKRHIVLHEPIKAVGSYKISVKFNHNLHGEFALKVGG